MNRKFLLGGVASVAVMAAASAQAATITNSFKLYEGTTGLTEIAPVSPGVYQIPTGTIFRIGIVSNVANGNPMQAHVDDETGQPFGAGEPLGLQNLTLNIVTPGTSGALVPVGTAATPPRWQGYARASSVITDAGGYGFVNLNDADGDGDRDVTGVGFSNNNLEVGLAANLPRYQIGAKGAQEIARGQYQAGSNNAAVVLRTLTTAANLFVDPPANDNSLAAQDALPSVTEGTITINIGTVIPPGGGTIGLGTTPNAGTTIPLTITGGNTSYVSSIFSAPAGTNVVTGNANLSAIGQEGNPLVLVRFSDTDTATGPALPGFIDSITAGQSGSTLVRVPSTDPAFIALAQHYGFLNDANAALFRLTDPDRILNFDFAGQGGIGIDRLAAVPEPGVIGLLGVAGLGLLSRRRRHA